MHLFIRVLISSHHEFAGSITSVKRDAMNITESPREEINPACSIHLAVLYKTRCSIYKV